MNRKINYSVYVAGTNYSAQSKRAATALARKACTQGQTGVFVEFFNPSNFQRGYLNRNGDYDVVGRDWSLRI